MMDTRLYDTDNLERNIIGALLLDGSLIKISKEIISSDHFANSVLEHLYQAILSLDKRKVAIDSVMVISAINANDIDLQVNEIYIYELAMNAGSCSNFMDYCNELHRIRLLDKFIDRLVE